LRLYADEQPAFVAALIGRHSRILGLHLNDGYAKRDDGLGHRVEAGQVREGVEVDRPVEAVLADLPQELDRLDARLRARPLRRRAAGLRGGADRPAQPHPRPAPQR
jgi:hypothetical protein